MKKFLIVVPVCNKDVDRAIAVAEWVAKLDPNIPTDLLVSAQTDTDPKKIETLARAYRKVFDKVSVHIARNMPASFVWPRPQNHMFQRTAQHICWKLLDQYYAFFFFEPDVTPLKSGWVKTLIDRYEAEKKPFMGCLRSVRTTSGKPLPSYMNGAGVYPADAIRRTARFITAKETPWDVLSGVDVVPDCAPINDLCMVAFGSSKYSGTRDFYTYVWSSAGSAQEVRATGTIGSQVILHHGCKDLSLLALLDTALASAPPPVPVPTPPVYTRKRRARRRRGWVH
jgi:hypothetical protein